MFNVLLISAAYSWFVGLLVIMLVMAVLFVVIALFALKPFKIDGMDDGSKIALKLLNEREAELTATLLNGGDKKEEVENQLRDVATAKKVVKELLSANDETASGLGVDNTLTAEEAAGLENGEKGSIEDSFANTPDESGLNKSFTAKLMQSSDDVKVWYFELKNNILCYEKTKALMRWSNEKFYIGKSNVASLAMRGKHLCLYLALKPAEYESRFPVKESTSELYKRATPCLLRIKNADGIKQAKELISLLMAEYGVKYVRTNHSIYALPYQDDDALLNQGLAKKE